VGKAIVRLSGHEGASGTERGSQREYRRVRERKSKIEAKTREVMRRISIHHSHIHHLAPLYPVFTTSRKVKYE
jgi:hypothetical protein